MARAWGVHCRVQCCYGKHEASRARHRAGGEGREGHYAGTCAAVAMLRSTSDEQARVVCLDGQPGILHCQHFACCGARSLFRGA